MVCYQLDKDGHQDISLTSIKINKLGYKYTKLELDMNSTHQVLAYADDVNLIGDDIRTIERNAEVLLNTCKGLAVNTEKTKYMEI